MSDKNNDAIVDNSYSVIIDIPPTRGVDYRIPVINELEERMPVHHQFRAEDVITWAHETTHGLNSIITNRLVAEKKAAIRGYYLGHGSGVMVYTPGIKLAQVADAVPKALRGNIYDLYLVRQQRYWNDVPSYVFNELVAYTQGTRCRNEAKLVNRSETVSHALEMMAYSAVYVDLAKKDARILEAYSHIMASLSEQWMLADLPDKTKQYCLRYLSACKSTLVSKVLENAGFSIQFLERKYL